MTDITRFKKEMDRRSFHTVTFLMDQRDGDCIKIDFTVDGLVDEDELIALAVALHFDELSDYDGEWYNLCPLENFLSGDYFKGFFYDACNGCKIDGICIVEYNSEEDRFYDVKIPSLGGLVIDDIDEVYEDYIVSRYDGSDDEDPVMGIIEFGNSFD